MSGIPFRPNGATVNIDVSASSQAVKISDGASSVRVMNNGSATVWVNYGPSDVAATLAVGIPVGPGVTEVISFVNFTGLPLYAAAIAAGTTGKIYFTPGAGI